MADVTADLALALELADAADAVTMQRFGAVDLAVETKPDLTPVSDADRAVETAVRERLGVDRPGDAVLGEEYGESGASTRRWIVDPVDGTRNFVRGAPVWATLLALQSEDDIVLGVVSAPALGRRWWAARGSGAWTSYGGGAPVPCHVSKVNALGDAFLAYSSLQGWGERGSLDGFLDLTRAVWRTRGFGDFWSHMLVAEGAVDLSCEPEVSLWDLAALQPIVEEAGGRFTDLSGVRGPGGGSVMCSNGLLHDDALALLAPG
ncbi:MAG: histidinol-phosphatase [Frankiales bacterium]|nr:histidinol-phosphatase [Frankiales bacterium]